MSDDAIRGLTTVALLKVNYDAGADHLDLFMPFVLDTLNAWRGDAFGAEDLAAQISSRHGLRVPVQALRTLLNRATNARHLRREGGRYFLRMDKPIDLDLLPQRQAIDREHRAVARKFIEFAAARDIELSDEEAALGLILAFLEANEVGILLEAGQVRLSVAADQQSTRELRTTAMFVLHVLESEPALAGYLQRMLEGLVLQNALLLTNVNLKRRQFKNIEVFFDTPFMFRLVGLASEPYVAAAREALNVLRHANAGISIFTKTVEEMHRVLAAIQRLIGTSSGIQQLRPTELVRFLLSRRYGPSDVAQVAALLERNVRQLGLTVRDVPRRIPLYTLDESDLAGRLMRPDQTEIDPRVDHDVSVVAGVLTFRRGRHCYSLDDARAIFATTTGLVVENVTKWYRAQGGEGIPPVIRQIALSNIAWLKNPSDVATQLKRHELVALCAAALRPTPEIWRRFTEELRRLRNSGELTTDEEVALLTSRLTDVRLAEIGDEDDVDAETVREILDRVRDSYIEEGARRTAEVVEEAEKRRVKEVEAARAAASEQEERLRSAVSLAQKSEEERRQTELRVIRAANRMGFVVATAAYWAVGLIVAVGLILGLPGFSLTSSLWASVLGGSVLAILAVLNFVDLHIGVSVAGLRRWLEAYVSRKLIAWWLPVR